MARKPELLCPAGDMEKLQMAVLYGADAVYLAGTSFGMRSFTGNFTPEELPKAIQFAHEHGVRVHVTVNTMPRNDEAAALPAWLEQLDAAGADALILADLGAFAMAGKYAPHCERHISTQQSIVRTSIISEITLTVFYFLNYDSSFYTGIIDDLTKRFFNCPLNNLYTCSFIIIIALHTFKRRNCTNISNSTTGNDTFSNCSTSGT